MADLVGRSEELAQWDDLLDQARRGVGQTMVVDGEAGIGKTALLDALTARATGFRQLRVHGVQAERTMAFAALHRLLMPILDQAGELPAAQEAALRALFETAEGVPERFLIGLAALTLLTDAATDAPVLCIVDDAHWIDAESLEIVSFVGRRLHADRVALVIAMRIEPDGPRAPEGLPRLHLDGLPASDARALLERAATFSVHEAVAQRIVDETSGSPLAIIEVVAALTREQLAGGRQLPAALPIGERLEAHFADRVGALPSPTRTYLLVAAADASGDPVLVAAAAARLGLPGDAAEPAVSAGLLAVDHRVRFGHPLIRSAVYRASDGEVRRAAHRALAAATDRDRDPDGWVWHLASSVLGPDDAVAEALAVRADHVQQRGGYAGAAALRTRAAELTADRTRRAQRLLSAARAHATAGAHPAAQALLADAEESLDDERLRAEAGRIRAVLQMSSAPGELPAMLLGAARMLAPIDPVTARHTFGEATQACLVSWQYTVGTSPTEVASAVLASGLLSEAREPRELLYRGFAKRIAGRFVDAVPDLRAAVEDALASPSALADLEPLGDFVGIVAAETWDIDGAGALTRALEAHERERGALLALRAILGPLAYQTLWCGGIAEAEAMLSEAVSLTTALGDTTFAWEPLKVELWAWQGDEARTCAVADQLVGQMAESFGGGVLANLGRLGLTTLHIAHGRYREALDASWPLFVDDPLPQGTQMLPSIVEAASRCGEPDAAAQALVRLEERATAAGTPWALGMLARATAMTAPDEATAESQYRASVEWLARSPVVTELARTRLVYGEWLRRQGRRLDAREQLARALDAFAAMGARGFEQRARTELAATGAVARQRTPDASVELTPQERQIALLAAQGATNREIATRLYVSASTVDYHLRKVFQKLGLSSRRELRTALA